MERPGFLAKIDFEFEVHPVVAILGPRQCGKTTLASMYAERLSNEPVTRFDLEDPAHLARLQTPKLALADLAGLVIIDEIQRSPELFPVLRVLVDRPSKPSRFLVLGSASRDLIRQSSESLAGRVGYIELTPFLLAEVGAASMQPLWVRGGFPRSFLAASEQISLAWRMAFVSTFLERDIPALGISIPPQAMRRMWTMLAHYHGQMLNASELGRSFGAADTTIRRYLDLLCSTFMVRRLPPWFENIKKRQVKTPKIYIRDSGLLHALLGIDDWDALFFHPKLGPSWEGFVIEAIIAHHEAVDGEYYFWSTHSGPEVDLLIAKNDLRFAYEIKHTDSPKLTQSMVVAEKALTPDGFQVVFPGSESFPLSETISAVGLSALIAQPAQITSTATGTPPQR
jgi:predicted AAA+ superfamily ATPase